MRLIVTLVVLSRLSSLHRGLPEWALVYVTAVQRLSPTLCLRRELNCRESVNTQTSFVPGFCVCGGRECRLYFPRCHSSTYQPCRIHNSPQSPCTVPGRLLGLDNVRFRSSNAWGCEMFQPGTINAICAVVHEIRKRQPFFFFLREMQHPHVLILSLPFTSARRWHIEAELISWCFSLTLPAEDELPYVSKTPPSPS